MTYQHVQVRNVEPDQIQFENQLHRDKILTLEEKKRKD
jgi:hypothetical protein